MLSQYTTNHKRVCHYAYCAVQPPAWHLCAPFLTLLRERNNNADLDTPGKTYLKLNELDSET